MAAAAKLVATAALTFASGGTFLGLTGFTAALASGVSSMALGFVSSALTKPKKASSAFANFAPQASEFSTLIRQPVVSRRVVIGEDIVSGPLTFYESTGNNRYHHLIIPLADHECHGWKSVYFGADAIYPADLDAAGNVISGKYAGKARIKFHAGTATQAADVDLVSEVASWTAAHQGKGVCYLYVRTQTDRDLFPGVIPQNIRCWLQGAIWYDPRDAGTRWTPNPALVTRGYLTNSRWGRAVATIDLDDSYFNAAANSCDEFVATKAVAHTVASVAIAGDTIDLAAARLEFQTGDRVQGTTTGTLPAGLAVLTDYFIIHVHEVSTTSQKVRVQLASTYDNSLAGVAVPLTGVGAGTHTLTRNAEPRFTANGLFETAQTPVDIIEDILSAMGGRLHHAGGKWRAAAAVWTAPTVTFDENDFRGAITVRGRHSRSNRFNAVKGVYSSPLNDGKPADYPAITSATYQAADGGVRVFKEFDLPLTKRSATAERLAKIALERHRRETGADVPLSLAGLMVQAGDTVAIDYARRSWVGKSFEIISFGFDVGEQAGAPIFGTHLTLQALDSTVFDWNETIEETTVAAAAAVNPLDPTTVGLPTWLVLTSGDAELFTKADGTIVSRIHGSWTAAADYYVRSYDAEFKKSSDTVWQTAGAAADKTDLWVWGAEEGIKYDFRVRAVNGVGVRSAWVTVSGHTVQGKSAKPAAPEIFTLSVDADGTRRYEWNLVGVPADVRAGGGYLIRYYLGATTDWTVMTALHSGVLQASPYESNALAAGTYTLAIKTIDSSNNDSATPTFISSVAIGDPRIANAIVQRTESGFDWPGVLVSCYKDGAALRATGSANWTTLPATWSALAASWDAIVASTSPISYTTPQIDLGQDLTFTPLVSVSGAGSQTITMQTGTVADGAATGGFTGLSTVTARYIKVKISLAGTVPVIDAMTTILDAPSKTERYDDVNTLSATNPWFERVAAGHFKIETRGGLAAITQPRISALQGVGGGWSWELVSKVTTLTAGVLPAAEFKIYNAVGGLADATADIEMIGPKA